jgi:uncharacterized protein (TIRG00374 family)
MVSRPVRWARHVKRILPAAVATLVIGALLLSFLDLNLAEMGHGVADRLRALSPRLVGFAFVVYLGSYFGRALRFAVLLPGLHGMLHLASIAGRHNFLNLVLPMRTGELSLPWMLNKECGRSLAEGGAALLICRVLDLLCVAAYLSLGIAWYGVGGATVEHVTARVTAVLVGLALIIPLMGPVARRAARIFGEDPDGRVRGFLARAAGHVGTMSLSRLAAATLVSLGTWALTYTTYYFMVGAMAGPDPVGQELGDIGFARSLVGTTGLHLSTVLPVNTLGGVGTWETGWVGGYTLLAGVSKEAAGVSGVVTHLLNFVFITIIGGAGFLLRKKSPSS